MLAVRANVLGHSLVSKPTEVREVIEEISWKRLRLVWNARDELNHSVAKLVIVRNAEDDARIVRAVLRPLTAEPKNLDEKVTADAFEFGLRGPAFHRLSG